MDPALWELLAAGAEGAAEVEAIIRLERPDVPVPGVRVVARFGAIATCRLRADAIRATRQDPNVISLKAARLVGPEAEPPVGAPASEEDRRRPAGLALTGAGVVVGVVDWGCDFDHPTFKRADGSTRLCALWDQRGPASPRSPQPYAYGVVHRRSDIDRTLAEADPYAALGYHPSAADRDGTGAHGTHVLDIAAGNGAGESPQGIAPEAELAFVHLADRGTAGLANLGDSVRILEGVDFVRRAAAGRPWVVNLSVGRHGGPHDGSTLAEQALGALLAEATGRFVVQSVGNYFTSATHASGQVRPGQVELLTVLTHPADRTPNELEVWYGGGDVLVVEIASPAGTLTGPVRLGERADVTEGHQVVGRIYHRARDPNNFDNHIDLFLFPEAPPGRWSVILRAERIVDGSFHAWLERDEACAHCQARFAGADRRCTTGTIANGHLPLVVGAYDGHSPGLPVARFSSAGPTRDGRYKPDMLAPGVSVLAARSAAAGSVRSPGLTVRKSGTSMATPHVTGAAALCLQARTLGAEDLRRVLLSTAVPAHGQPDRSGAGHLDIAAAVEAVRALPSAARRPRQRVRHHSSQEAKMEQDQALATVQALGPARVYREIVNQQVGPQSSAVAEQFEVLARPGEPLTARLAPGDLLLTVPLGQPGPGTVAFLADGALGPAPGGSGMSTTVRDAPARPVLVVDAKNVVPPGQLLLRPLTPPSEALGERDGSGLAEDATNLGRDLVRRFPAGVRVAVYDPDDAELSRRAADWARREEAVGARGTPIAAANLALGIPLPDTNGLVRTVTDLGRALAEATGTATGPALIRTLALFAHGWDAILAIGMRLTAGNVDDVIRRLAPALTDDVTVVLYGCSVCKQAGEDGWITTTMGSGGAKSLCARIRDALIDQGKRSATVWGHTEVGHTTRNWSLRRFGADPAVPNGGKGRPGDAYAGDIVFGAERSAALAQLEAAMNAQGYRVVDARRAAFSDFMGGRLDREFYRAYGQANRSKNHGGANLSERAPLFPDEVAEIIRDHWRAAWGARRFGRFAAALIPRLRGLRVVERVPAAGDSETIADVEGVLSGPDANAEVDLPREASLEETDPLTAALGGGRSLPFLLAGPIVRRTEPDSVWFWVACSGEIQACTPTLTTFKSDGSVEADATRGIRLAPPELRVARLGERLWVGLARARLTAGLLSRGYTYGYDLSITGPSSTVSVRLLLPDLAYRPFDRPTFSPRSTKARFAHGSCRRPGALGQDAFPVFDRWLASEVLAGANGARPPALILTGDQIYADDVAFPLFEGVRRLAADLFGYVESLPAVDGRGTVRADSFGADDWRGRRGGAPPNSRAWLTRRRPGKPDRPGPIGFSTEDGEGHLLSFAEFAAMYLITWNPELWKAYVLPGAHPTDDQTNNLRGFGDAVAASRRVLANMSTYMLLDDHEVTDDWNIDAAWVQATTNSPLARRIISNGLAAYWAFQAWGNDPNQFNQAFVDTVTRHLDQLTRSMGQPGPAASAYDSLLYGKHWSFVAPTSPPALCVDTRTRREFRPGETATLSGPTTWVEIAPLLRGHGLTANSPLLIVLPTPLLPHRSMLYAQNSEYDLPEDRYEGDYEGYGNNPGQRADLVEFLRRAVNPSALVVFSGDVHHGSVVNGMYVGGARLQDLYDGRGRWALRVVQVTSSPIKNIKKDAFLKRRWWTAFQTDAGNVGETIVPQYENQYKTLADGTAIALRSDVARLSGALGRQTYIFENHLCVVDLTGFDVDVLFVGVKGGNLATATTRVSLSSDPRTFRPPIRRHPVMGR